MKSFQDIIFELQSFWADYGCLIFQPYNSEVGAGTFNPATFFGVLGPNPRKVAYLELSRRPRDGRYGQNPFRFQQFYQWQVILKPAPTDVQEVYLRSLESLGIELAGHDVRFVEDDWEAPTLGAWGLGWEVWLDGMEIVQFTYFQQVGGLDLELVSAELTYGLERIASIIQGVDSCYHVEWTPGLSWGDVYQEVECQFSKFNFEEASVELNLLLFDKFEDEAKRLIDEGLFYPGYDYVIKCSHLFNLLEARGAISVAERANYIARVRRLARRAALAYLKQGESGA